MAYAPPYSTTDKMVTEVATISRLLGEFSAKENLSRNPRLRRLNRIRSIHSSLAIENNTLTLDEVTAVLDGRRVLAPPQDIHEAKNAYEAYEHLSQLDPFSIDDLLKAHGFMMSGLIKDAGRFRSGNVGVFAGEALVHAGTPARYVAQVMSDLFEWLRTTEAHPLISSCVFHFEFEYIHPFSDGNGRTGRMWQSLLLQRWEPLFAWLPIETLVAEHQQEYYDALGQSRQDADATKFVEFMLGIIVETLREQVLLSEADNKADNKPDNISDNNEWTGTLLELMRSNPSITQAELVKLLGVARSTLTARLAELQAEGVVRRVGARKNGHWEVLGE